MFSNGSNFLANLVEVGKFHLMVLGSTYRRRACVRIRLVDKHGTLKAQVAAAVNTIQSKWRRG
jgi:hypothetical protein